MAFAFRRTRPFRSRTPSAPVKLENVPARRDGKCRACGQAFAKGEEVLRIRLRKSFRSIPCPCGRKLPGLKYFHPACAPADPVKAMGVDVNAVRAAASSTPGPTIARPMTAQEATLAAMLAMEKALSVRVHKMSPAEKLEVGGAFDKYRKLKALALSPGTEAEGVTALKMAMVALVKLTY